MSANGLRPHVRAANDQDLATILELASAEGWEPGVGDHAVIKAIKPLMFAVIVDGECVGGVSAHRWSDAFVFLGYYLIAPSHRGRGLGSLAWSAAMETIGPTASAALDAVPSLESTYSRWGFSPMGTVGRFSGVTPSSPVDAGVGASTFDGDPEELVDWWSAQGAEPARRRYLRVWFSAPQHKIAVSRSSGGELTGLAVARPTNLGARLGPVRAPDPGTAVGVAHLAVRQVQVSSSWDQCRVTAHIPMANPHGLAMAEALNLGAEGETLRMHRGSGPWPDVADLFALVSPELG